VNVWLAILKSTFDGLIVGIVHVIIIVTSLSSIKRRIYIYVGVCANVLDKEFQGQVIHVEMAARKVPPGGFVRGRGKMNKQWF